MKRKIVSGIMLTLLLIGMLTLAFDIQPAEMARYEQENSAIEYGRKEIIVKFKSSILESRRSDALTLGIHSIDKLNRRFGVVEIEKVFVTSHPSLSTVYKLKFSHHANISHIISKYNADPNVDYAEPNYVGRAAATPNDADYGLQWAHQNIESELAWNIQTGHPSIIIAVVDTGVDWNHPDLATNIWINPYETVNGIDDDDNGYVDDIRGWDFVDTTDPVWPGEDGTVRDNDPMDFHGHGTHVAGIAAAVTNNTIGVAGMSWKSRIMAVRAGYKNSTGGSRFWWSDVAPAIVYAADNGAKIISMSFGGYGSSSLLEDAVNYAYSKGVILVAAAMNDNVDTKPYPAGYDNVVAVAATNSTDGKASFSNYGSWVDVSAPGVDIYSTLFDNTYASWSGTSMSTPYVSGLAGLILSENSTLMNEEVRNVIRNTTDPTHSSVPIGTGRVNAYKALLRVYISPRISHMLFPSSGPVGTLVTVSGEIYPAVAGHTINVYWEDKLDPNALVCSDVTGADGTYMCTFTVMADVAGDHSVIAVDMDSGATPLASCGTAFEIEPLIELCPPCGECCTIVTAIGTGFPGDTWIYWDTPGWDTDPDDGDVKSSASGSWSADFHVLECSPSVYEFCANGVCAEFIVGPCIELDITCDVNPDSGPVGTQVTVSGEIYPAVAGHTINVYWEEKLNPAALVWSGDTDSSGVYECLFIVMADVAGDHSVIAVDMDSGATPLASCGTAFEIQPMIGLCPICETCCEHVTAIGTGFPGDTWIDWSTPGWDTDPEQGSVKSSETGSWSVEFHVEDCDPGVYEFHAGVASAEFMVGPLLLLDRDHGQPCECIEVEGCLPGLAPGTPVYIYFEHNLDPCVFGTRILVGEATVSKCCGYFEGTFHVPNVPAGCYIVNATDDGAEEPPFDGTVWAAFGCFYVRTYISIDPTEGAVGDTIVVYGYGYIPTDNIYVFLEGLDPSDYPPDGKLLVGTTTTDCYGCFGPLPFDVPGVPIGEYIVNATDNATVWAATEFKIIEIVEIPIKGGENATITGNVTLTNAIITKNTLHFDASGPSGSTGWINVTFPMINTTDIKVFINKEKLTPPPFPIITTNGTHYFIYFEFTLSTHTITIQFAPLEYTLAIDSLPIGVTFTVDGVPRSTPWSGNYSEGTSISLVMPETHDEYIWLHWLEDGDTNRTKTIVLTGNTTWTGVFRFMADINGDGIVNIKDIAICCKAFGSTPSDPRWDPRADLNQDGIIDIIDLVLIAVNFGKTL